MGSDSSVLGGVVAAAGGVVILPGSISRGYHGEMDQPVAWTATLPGPWSPIHLAVSARGVVAVAWLTSDTEFEAALQERLHGPVANVAEHADGPQAALLAHAVRGVQAVLAGEPPGTLPVDLGDRPEWDRLVLEAVRDIPLGSTASYGEIARRIGRRGAARAVGGAVGRNPITLLIPCHRVIAADGTLGGYGGDGWGGREERLAIKRDLLLREGVTVARGRG
jgi:methylated-DNA-[protein]-cysteine S-methyltransferase